MTRQRAGLELVFAGALWGFGFVSTVWALRAYSPAEILIIRFAIAVLAGEAFWWLILRPRRKGARAASDGRSDARWALPAGFLMAALLLPQTIGLLSTTASKSGFLTTLYVIFVPFLNRLVFGAPLRGSHLLDAAIAVVGAFLLMDASLTGFVPGDLWTVLCAFFAAVHILFVGRIADRIRDSFRFNTFQSFACLLAILPFLFFQGPSPRFVSDGLAWAGILSLALGSTLIGFTIQVRTQKVLSPMAAAMLFLLESPFALIFGILFLKESLSPIQVVGALLILASAALSVRTGH